MKYYLDPDYRTSPPKTGAYCIRCQKPIKDPSIAIHVTSVDSGWNVIEGGKELLGPDCWKIVKNNKLD